MKLTKHCCNESTHFPAKMYNCESYAHDAASYVSDPASLDHIISITPTSINVKDTTVHDILITDHKPISCRVNGVPIVSWNIEGLCTDGSRLDAVKNKIRKFISKGFIIIIQELFLQDKLRSLSQDEINILTVARMRTIFGVDSHSVRISDGYTGAMYIPTIYYDKKPLSIKRINSNKQCLVLYINCKNPFYLVNMHLKSTPLTLMGKRQHYKEVLNILSVLHEKKILSVGAIFMGDHNRITIEKIYDRALQTVKQNKTRRRKRV